LAFVSQALKIDARNSRFREVARAGDALLPGDLEGACFEGGSTIAGCYIFSDTADKYRVFVTFYFKESLSRRLQNHFFLRMIWDAKL
jgi:hypothetical protein